MTVPTSAASIHAVFTRHLADLEASGPRPGRYVYRFDNGMCLRIEEKITIVGLLQATTFDGEETERPGYASVRNLRGDRTDIISFRLARKLGMEKLQCMLLDLEIEPRVEAAA